MRRRVQQADRRQPQGSSSLPSATAANDSCDCDDSSAIFSSSVFGVGGAWRNRRVSTVMVWGQGDPVGRQSNGSADREG